MLDIHALRAAIAAFAIRFRYAMIIDACRLRHYAMLFFFRI